MNCNDLADRLRDAKDAYYRILTGQNVIIVIDQNGERIEYQKANITALAEYIRKLELELASCSGGVKAHQPLRIYF
nr:MAG TPA: Head to tail joining protein [Caudoviricetes sp.]